MAELAKMLHFLKSGTEQTAKAYSTADEAGDNYVQGKVDNVACYIPIGATDDAMATNGRVIKGGTTYAIKSQAKPPYAKIEYTTAGTHTFTVPTGVTTLRVTVAGAGGGGGGGAEVRSDDNTFNGRGGAGGTGGLNVQIISVTAGTSYGITVGAGGGGGKYDYGDAPVKASAGSAGGSSAFGTQVTATGGGGGGGSYTSGNLPKTGSAGSAGTPSGAGASGGAGGYGHAYGSAGSTGWVYVEYGGDI